jgi:hypothetical protein
MAFHVRRQIRDAIVGLLVGLPSTAGRVYKSRVYPLETQTLPGLLIYSENETSSAITFTPPTISERNLTLRIEAVAASVSGLDDELDQICQEVETALTTTALEPLARSIVLTATTITLEGTSEQPTGTAEMTFEVIYQTAAGAPDVAL